MISIVIVAHNAHEYTAACLKSIFENTKEEYEIILVDNGSDPAGLPDGFYAHKVIRNEENLGYPKAANQGIRAAKGDAICLINNDIIVTPNWLTNLKYHIDNGYDIVGATANVISGPQQVLVSPYDGIDELNKVALKQYQSNKFECVPFHRVVLFCALINRKVIDTIGVFDEIFSPGNFEDDDFCFRAIDAGFTCGIAKDVFVHHFGGVTHKSVDIDYENLLKRNKDIMYAKWPPERYRPMVNKALEQYGGATEGTLSAGAVKVALLSANFGNTDPDLHKQHVRQTLLNGYRLDKFYYTEEVFPLRSNAISVKLQTMIPKMYGWELQPGHDIYLWLDGNITLKNKESASWFLKQIEGYDIALFNHVETTTIVEELNSIKLLMAGGDKYALAHYMGEPFDEQVSKYLSDPSFKDEHMYSSNAFIYRNTGKMRAALAEWFSHCARYSVREQLSLPYILHKFDCRVNKIDEHIFSNDYVEYHSHRMVWD